MMEAGWSARREAVQLGHSNCVVRRCSDRLIREMLFTRRPGSGCPRQTNRREDHHIVKNARVQPIASSATIKAQVAPSLGAPVSPRIIRRCLAEGHLGSLAPITCATLNAHSSTPPFGRCHTRGN
ncbi:transposable element Tcb2 transposase [Trichonephila clavipes]|nr:transposable element Tcb2 transposase [Trichonephila clavipes]